MTHLEKYKQFLKDLNIAFVETNERTAIKIDITVEIKSQPEDNMVLLFPKTTFFIDGFLVSIMG